MAETSIEWTEKTWNPVTGCTRASAGCDNCYAVTMTHRLEAIGMEKYSGLTVLNGKGDRHFNGVVRTHEDALLIPLGWKKPARVFVNSMSDLFHGGIYGQGHSDSTWKEGVFNSSGFEFLIEVWRVMKNCPQHTFQILTKRPRIAADLVWRVTAKLNLADPLPNVWLGASVENQQAADERIPHLLRCPAAVRFISAEPLLGQIRFDRLEPGKGMDGLDCLRGGWHQGDGRIYENYSTPTGEHGRIDWIIAGGESGPGARSCNVEWIREIVRQCKAANVACFVKQLGSRAWDARIASLESVEEMQPEHLNAHGRKIKDKKGGNPSEWPEDLRVREFPRP